MKFFVQGITRLDDARTSVRQVGEFATHDEAIAASKRMIDDFLAREHKPGMNAALLYGRYQRFGESPFIFGDAGHTMDARGFNHLQYAKTRCDEICGPASK